MTRADLFNTQRYKVGHIFIVGEIITIVSGHLCMT